jgi:putative alpha-1,2-mannosidase
VLNVFIGYDPRQPLAYNVLQHSIFRHASVPVSITALKLDQLPISRRGLTEFTFSRFLVPYLCCYGGPAVFMDADVVVTGDIAELFAQSDTQYAVQVMQNQPQFEWPSVMLFNCYQAKKLTPEWVGDVANKPFKLDSWGKVGTFSDEWNHCVGYAEPRTNAKLYHYTQGIPIWNETRGLPEDAAWIEEYQLMTKTCGWSELMGGSVHAEATLKRWMQARWPKHLKPIEDAAA